MNEPMTIPVDFGNAEEDGAVRLNTRGTLQHLQSASLALSEGLQIAMSDGELVAEGTCVWRDGIWVAVVTGWKT
jgi:hypothetical protein